MQDLLRIVAVLALVAGNAFFVIGEYAVVTARRTAVAARPGAGSAAALRLMDDPVRVISTVQVGITALGILTGAVSEPLVRALLGDGVPHWLGFVIGFSVVTYLSVVLGELVPKALTLDRADRLAVLVARPVEWLSVLLRPVVWVLQGSAQLLLRPFGVREVSAGDSIRSPEELRALVDEAESTGVIGRAQEELLHNVFDFPAREARDVMIPAPDVFWLDAALPVREALDRAMSSSFSRFPVGDGSLDRALGVVHVRDLLEGVRSGADTARSVAQHAPIVPETKALGALLRELREQRRHFAIVGDEYGGTLGIVTMEDVLEELVGEIEDEYDVPVPHRDLERVDEATVRVAGAMPVEAFNHAVGAELPEDGPHTMAGLAFDALGRRPEPGDEVQLEGAQLTVETVDGARITRLRVRSAPG